VQVTDFNRESLEGRFIEPLRNRVWEYKDQKMSPVPDDSLTSYVPQSDAAAPTRLVPKRNLFIAISADAAVNHASS
jgi:hypothetical protein